MTREDYSIQVDLSWQRQINDSSKTIFKPHISLRQLLPERKTSESIRDFITNIMRQTKTTASKDTTDETTILKLEKLYIEEAKRLGDPADEKSFKVNTGIGGERWISFTSKDRFGVALSGGGIRSATFNLGLLQSLAQLKVLPSVDYLSTVSGGGYVGGFWTAWLHRHRKSPALHDFLWVMTNEAANGLRFDICGNSADFCFHVLECSKQRPGPS